MSTEKQVVPFPKLLKRLVKSLQDQFNADLSVILNEGSEDLGLEGPWGVELANLQFVQNPVEEGMDSKPEPEKEDDDA